MEYFDTFCDIYLQQNSSCGDYRVQFSRNHHEYLARHAHLRLERGMNTQNLEARRWWKEAIQIVKPHPVAARLHLDTPW